VIPSKLVGVSVATLADRIHTLADLTQERTVVHDRRALHLFSLWRQHLPAKPSVGDHLDVGGRLLCALSCPVVLPSWLSVLSEDSFQFFEDAPALFLDGGVWLSWRWIFLLG